MGLDRHTTFLASTIPRHIPTFVPDFHASENARHALRNAMGTAHEQEHCEHYSNTLTAGRRVMGCWHRDIFNALADDWAANRLNIQGPQSMELTVDAVRRAAVHFGGNLSIARERAISRMLVEQRGTRFLPDDRRLIALAATFDDVSLLVERAVITLTIGDELPRMLRPERID